MSYVYVLSDLHLSDKPIDEYRFTFMNTHFPSIMSRREKPSAILILGDLTQEKDYHAARFVNRVVDCIDRLAKIAPVVILMGNHDYANEGYAFFEFLSRLENVYWIAKPLYGMAFPNETLKKTFAKALFLPHTRNHKRDWDGIEMSTFATIFAHNTFEGSDSGGGHKLSGIPISVFPKGAHVISGDVHFPQTLGPITYIGSPYTITFGDKFKARIMKIEPRHGVQRVTSIYVDAFPQKKMIAVTSLDDLGRTENVNANDIVEIRLEVDTMNDWQDKLDAMMEWAVKRKVYLARAKPILLERATRRNIRISGNEVSDTEVIEKFGKRNNLDEDQVKAGLSIFGG